MATMRQGAQDANAFLDIEAMNELRRQARQAGPSMYGGVERNANFNSQAHEPAFLSATRDEDDDLDTLYVLTALNGQGAIASELYRNDGADGVEMVRQAVKNSIRFAGITIAGCRYDDKNGSAISVAGLETVKIGNGQYGPNMSSETRIAPGQACVWEVPVPGDAGLQPPPMGDYTEQVYRSKFVLQLRPRDPRNAGDALLFHMRQFLDKPNKWLLAMNEQLYGTHKWASACRSFARMFTTALALGAGELVRAGLVVPTPGAVAELVVDDAAGRAALLAAAGGAEVAADQRALVADTFAASLGELLKAIEPSAGSRVLARVNTLNNADRRKELRALPARFLNVVLTDGRNTEFEVGFDRSVQPPVYRGRYDARSGSAIDRASSIGALLDGQLNAVWRGLAAVMDAAQEDDRWNAGVALTPAGDGGSMYVKLATGIRR